LIAKAFFPSGRHIKQALSYLDLAIKMEIVIYELSSGLFLCSVFELWMFIFSFFLFVSDASEMGQVWLHVCHVPRGIIGLIIMKRLPQSHDMAANISIPPNLKIPINSLMTYVIQGARDALTLFSNSTKKLLLAYFLLTLISVAFDCGSFISAVKGFGEEEEGAAYHDITMTFLACVFLFVDYFYLLWIYSLTMKFPTLVGKAAIKGLLGAVESIH